MRAVAHIRPFGGLHQGGIGIGGADEVISHALIATAFHLAILCSQLFDPVMTLGILLAKFLLKFLGDQDGKLLWNCCCFLACLLIALLLSTLGCFLASFAKQAVQVCFDIKARFERVPRGIGLHLGSINV